MNAGVRVAAFAALLALIFAAAALAGRAIDPGTQARAEHGEHLIAAGAASPRGLPAPSAMAHTDGYDVALREGAHGTVTLTVSRGGAPVADLQPYLGARGHLVAVRVSDLAYDRVHPLAGTGAPGAIAFSSAGSAPGTYRLFFEFRHGDRLHTAAFTRKITP